MNSHPLQSYYSRIHTTYDLVNALFTFGLDKRWRRYTVNKCLAANPDRILDLCCGTGDLAIMLSKSAGLKARIIAYDLNHEMLDIARQKALKEKVTPEFIQGDAGNMPFENEEFDSITIGFGFRNLTWENPERDRHIREISRILKPGGNVFILESARPKNGMIGMFYRTYLKLVLVPLGGLLSGDWNAYRYLAGSSAEFYGFDELMKIMGNFKLSLHKQKSFMLGSVNLMVATKK